MIMKIKTKLLNVKQIHLDKELYPRMQVDRVTTARYYNALNAGATFPPIRVALLDGKYVLMDGAHRLEAHKGVKHQTIEAEVVEGLTREQVYVEAVKANISHGRQFSTQEVTNIIVTMGRLDISQEMIAEIVRIPLAQLQPFVAKRLTRITDSGEQIALKASSRQFAGTSVGADFESKQEDMPGMHQARLFETVVNMLENNMVDTSNPIVMRALIKIHRLLTPLVPIRILKK